MTRRSVPRNIYRRIQSLGFLSKTLRLHKKDTLKEKHRLERLLAISLFLNYYIK